MGTPEQNEVNQALDDHEHGDQMAEELVWEPETQTIVSRSRDTGESSGLKYKLDRMKFAAQEGKK